MYFVRRASVGRGGSRRAEREGGGRRASRERVRPCTSWGVWSLRGVSSDRAERRSCHTMRSDVFERAGGREGRYRWVGRVYALDRLSTRGQSQTRGVEGGTEKGIPERWCDRWFLFLKDGRASQDGRWRERVFHTRAQPRTGEATRGAGEAPPRPASSVDTTPDSRSSSCLTRLVGATLALA